MTYHGIIPVFKPKGYTSHDIVAIIRKATRQKRVGHTGTLDPQVEGVLPICLGRATRVVEYIQDLPKRYRGSFVLGIATDTQDQSGEVIERALVENVGIQDIEAVFKQFIGEISQIPPMYSAVKVNGKRLYESARKGEIVARSSRKVYVYDLICLSLSMQDGLPVIHFDVVCSKGTYIRTLCVDIGKVLGYPAYMNSLIRTESGPFHLEDCLTLDEVQLLQEKEQIPVALTTIDEVLGHFPALVISESDKGYVRDGCSIVLNEDMVYRSLFRIYTDSGQFCALYSQDRKTGLGIPKKVFWDVEK